jgi:methylthioribose-1-phosphate isomerase
MSIKKKKSTVLIYGNFQESLFDRLQKKKRPHIVVMEGRPNLEAARQVSQQLLDRRMTPTIISDNMAGFLFSQGMIKEVWLAYHSSAQDGITGTIGSLILAILGKKHHVPVYCYPAARADRMMGQAKDIFYFAGQRIAPSGIGAYVPLLEWVPRKYVRKIYE